jgi:hypothetical protein
LFRVVLRSLETRLFVLAILQHFQRAKAHHFANANTATQVDDALIQVARMRLADLFQRLEIDRYLLIKQAPKHSRPRVSKKPKKDTDVNHHG